MCLDHSHIPEFTLSHFDLKTWASGLDPLTTLSLGGQDPPYEGLSKGNMVPVLCCASMALAWEGQMKGQKPEDQAMQEYIL